MKSSKTWIIKSIKGQSKTVGVGSLEEENVNVNGLQGSSWRGLYAGQQTKSHNFTVQEKIPLDMSKKYTKVATNSIMTE
jgi:hypothetical protein